MKILKRAWGNKMAEFEFNLITKKKPRNKSICLGWHGHSHQFLTLVYINKKWFKGTIEVLEPVAWCYLPSKPKIFKETEDYFSD